MSSLKIVRPTYQMTENAPIKIVDTAGVKNRGWISPRRSGIALYLAIDSVVRAVGRIVVWVDAAAEVSTAMIRILFIGFGNTSSPSTLRTSSEFSTSWSTPPYACAAVETSRYMPTSTRVATTAAIPGILDDSSVSSFTVTRLSQPQ
jgi:hypothetical protein